MCKAVVFATQSQDDKLERWHIDASNVSSGVPVRIRRNS